MQTWDSDLTRLGASFRARSLDPVAVAIDPSQAVTDKTRIPGFDYGETNPWRLNYLSVMLLAALVVTLFAVVALRVRLTRALAQAGEAMAELAETDRRLADLTRPAAMEPRPFAETERPAIRPAAASADLELTPPPASQKVLVMLAVGARRLAEKEVERLRPGCRASLALLRQQRGRCAFSNCWVVAADGEDSRRARACGKVKGTALRDRTDFEEPGIEQASAVRSAQDILVRRPESARAAGRRRLDVSVR
jgi:hypothetical protein